MLEINASDPMEIRERLKHHQKIHYKSRFKFLMAHKGVRPGTFTGLMGTAGAGKSTLVKSIISDCAEQIPITIYLTEEKTIDYEIKLHEMKSKMENITFIEESMIPFDEMDLEGAMIILLENLFMVDSDIIFMDNITTSTLYERFGLKGQTTLVNKLRDFANNTGKTIFFIAHTKKDADNNGYKLFNGGDIRGTYQLYQQAEYFYIMQPISVKDQLFPIMQITKHRFHEINKRYYLLGFKDGFYKFDMEINFDKIRDIFKKRNTLR